MLQRRQPPVRCMPPMVTRIGERPRAMRCGQRAAETPDEAACPDNPLKKTTCDLQRGVMILSLVHLHGGCEVDCRLGRQLIELVFSREQVGLTSEVSGMRRLPPYLIIIAAALPSVGLPGCVCSWSSAWSGFHVCARAVHIGPPVSTGFPYTHTHASWSPG